MTVGWGDKEGSLASWCAADTTDTLVLILWYHTVQSCKAVFVMFCSAKLRSCRYHRYPGFNSTVDCALQNADTTATDGFNTVVPRCDTTMQAAKLEIPPDTLVLVPHWGFVVQSWCAADTTDTPGFNSTVGCSLQNAFCVLILWYHAVIPQCKLRSCRYHRYPWF